MAARRATTALFLLTGLVSASWAARIPAIREALALSPGELGLAVLGLEGGALAGLPAGAALTSPLGSRAAATLGFALFAPGLVLAGLAPGVAALALALGAFATANSVVDVALNAQGAELERRAGAPVLGRAHSGHAFGVMVGGLGGAAAAAAGASPAAHFAGVALLALLVLPAATRQLVREAAPPAGGGALRAVRDRRLVLLGAVAFCAFLLDGAAYNWLAVQLREGGASPAVAACGVAAFAGALGAGRLVTDRLVAHHGRGTVVRAGGLVAAAGAAVALLAPATGLALAGWAVFGAGLAPLAPTVLGAAASASAAPAPAAIAAVTTIGYLGSFTGPPLIGALAGGIGLDAALGLLVVAALAAAALARAAAR